MHSQRARTQQQGSDPGEMSSRGLAVWRALLLCVRQHEMMAGLEKAVDESAAWFDVGEKRKRKLALGRWTVGLASKWGWS